MTVPDLTDILRNIQFLRDVPGEHVQQLASIAEVADYPAGTTIFRQGDPARSIYLVVEGTVKLEICASGTGCRQILTVGPGELLGWSALLEERMMTATARAVVPTRVVRIDGLQAAAMCNRDPRLGYELMKRAVLALARRLNATRLQLVNVYGDQMPNAEEVTAKP